MFLSIIEINKNSIFCLLFLWSISNLFLFVDSRILINSRLFSKSKHVLFLKSRSRRVLLLVASVSYIIRLLIKARMMWRVLICSENLVVQQIICLISSRVRVVHDISTRIDGVIKRMSLTFQDEKWITPRIWPFLLNKKNERERDVFFFLIK